MFIQIYVNLRLFDYLLFKIRVQVEDGGSPPWRVTSILTVNVLRNQNAPKFSRTDYAKTILETHAIGQSVMRVKAEDADKKAPQNIVMYELDHPFFSIKVDDGTITVKRSLLGDGADEYRVILSLSLCVCVFI